MDEKQKQIEELRNEIRKAEKELESAKNSLLALTKDELTSDNIGTYSKPSSDKVVEGIFNGENMVGPEGKVYPVPANYASKSKLVEGDKLKLTISVDGSFLFKQIAPVQRKNVIGTLKFENNAYHVEAEGSNYNVLYASVTYHKAKPGDKVVIVIPTSGDVHWSVLESIIHDLSPEDKVAAEKIIEDKVAEEMKQEAAAISAPADGVFPASVHLAPSSTTGSASSVVVPETPLVSQVNPDTNQQTSQAEPNTNPLEIDELEIKGSNRAPAPKAVDAVDPNVLEPVPATVTNNTTAQAQPISEMEI